MIQNNQDRTGVPHVDSDALEQASREPLDQRVLVTMALLTGLRDNPLITPKQMDYVMFGIDTLEDILRELDALGKNVPGFEGVAPAE